MVNDYYHKLVILLLYYSFHKSIEVLLVNSRPTVVSIVWVVFVETTPMFGTVGVHINGNLFY
jgi:hypothetical protein